MRHGVNLALLRDQRVNVIVMHTAQGDQVIQTLSPQSGVVDVVKVKTLGRAAHEALPTPLPPVPVAYCSPSR